MQALNENMFTYFQLNTSEISFLSPFSLKTSQSPRGGVVGGARFKREKGKKKIPAMCLC